MKMLKNLLVLVFGLAVVGCTPTDKPPAYTNVTGKVTFNGKPIEKGTITFSTDGRPPSLMDIVDGKFTGQAMTGSNKISVSYKRKSAKASTLSPDAAMRIQKQGSSGPASANPNAPTEDIGTEELIPPEWGTTTKQIRVVEPGGANSFDFEIKGKQ